MDKVVSTLKKDKRTQAQLADIVGCSERTIVRYIREMKQTYNLEMNERMQFYINN